MTTLYVGTSEGCYSTITDAVAAANDGDTIIVKGSEYALTNEAVNVSKALTIQAEGNVAVDSFAIGTGTAKPQNIVINGFTIKPANNRGIYQSGTNVTTLEVKDCTFDLTEAKSGITGYGIHLNLNVSGTEKVTVDGCTFNGDGYWTTYAMHASYQSSVEFTNNIVNDISGHAVQLSLTGPDCIVYPEDAAVVFDGNTFTNIGACAIYAADLHNNNVTFDVSNNEFTNINIEGGSQKWGAICIGPGNKVSEVNGLTIENNTIVNGNVGIYQSVALKEGATGTISISGNDFALSDRPGYSNASITYAASALNVYNADNTISAGDFTGNIVITSEPATHILVDANLTGNNGDMVIVDGKAYIIGTNAFTTINKAVTEAKKSTEYVTIEINSGDYTENVNFSGKKYIVDGATYVGGITFKAVDDANVNINGNFQCNSASVNQKDIVFDGLTITNSEKNGGYYAPIMFADNYAGSTATGIVIQNCTLNSATTAGSSIGVALTMGLKVEGVTVKNNTINAECAVYGGDGNPISNLSVIDNKFTGSETMANYTYWGVIYIYNSGAGNKICGNKIDNSAFRAVRIRNGNGILFADNVITDCYDDNSKAVELTNGSTIGGVNNTIGGLTNTIDGEDLASVLGYTAYTGSDIFVRGNIAGYDGDFVVLDNVMYEIGKDIFADVNTAAAMAETTAGKMVIMEGSNVAYDANPWFLLNAPQEEIEPGIWNYDVAVDASKTYDLQIDGTISAYQLLLNNAETVVSTTGKLIASGETLRIMDGSFTVYGTREAGAGAPDEVFVGSWGGGTKPGADTQIKAGYIQINQGAVAEFNNTVVFVNAGWMNFDNAEVDFNNTYIYLGSGGSYAPIAVQVAGGANVTLADNTTLINDKTFTMNITVDAASTLVMDATSTITATTLTVAEGGQFIINAAGFTGYKKIVDLSGDASLEGKVTVQGEGVNVIYGADGDITLSTVDMSVMYVNAAFTGKLGDDLGDGKFYGINAFGSLSDAVAAKTADTKEFVIESDISDAISGKTLSGNITTENANGVKISDSENSNYVNMNGLTLGDDVTLEAKYVYVAGENVIDGAVSVATTFYSSGKTTVNGSMEVYTLMSRYYDSAEDGIYVVGNAAAGEGKNAAVQVKANNYLGHYSGTFSVKDTAVEFGYILLNGSNDKDGYSTAKLVLDNAKVATSVGGNTQPGQVLMDDDAEIIAANDSVLDFRGLNNFGYLSMGANNKISLTDSELLLGRDGQGSSTFNGKVTLDGSALKANGSINNGGTLTASNDCEITIAGTLTNNGTINVKDTVFTADKFYHYGTEAVFTNVDLNVNTFVNGQNASSAYAVVGGTSKIQIANGSGYFSLRLADDTVLKDGTSIVGSLTARAQGDVTFGEAATDFIHLDSFDTRDSYDFDKANTQTITVNGTLDIAAAGKGFSTYWMGIYGSVNADDANVATILTGAGTINSHTAAIFQYGKIVVDEDLTINVTDQYAADFRITLTDITIKGEINGLGSNNKLSCIQTSNVTITGEKAALNIDSYLLIGYHTYKGSNDTTNTYKSTVTVNDGAAFTVGGTVYLNQESALNIAGGTFSAGSLNNYGGTITVSGNSTITVDEFIGNMTFTDAVLNNASMINFSGNATVTVEGGLTFQLGDITGVENWEGSGILYINDVTLPGSGAAVTLLSDSDDTITAEQLVINGSNVVDRKIINNGKFYTVTNTDGVWEVAEYVAEPGEDPIAPYTPMTLYAGVVQGKEADADGNYTFEIDASAKGGQIPEGSDYTYRYFVDDKEIAGNTFTAAYADGDLIVKVVATDVFGTSTEVSSNIKVTVKDYTAPVLDLNTNDYDSGVWSQSAVTLTASASDIDNNGAKVQYSIDGGNNWADFDGSVTLTDGEYDYWFKAVDNAGHESAIEKINVKVDSVAPEAPVASANVTDPTNGKVAVSAEFSVDTVKKEYSLDGVEYSEYTGAVIFDDNGSVWFRGTDAAGNVSDVIKHEVTNIDKVAPVAPVASADVTDPTNGQVAVSAEFSADTMKKEYSLDGIEYFEYNGSVIFDDNGSVWFRGIDAAGNVSDVIKHEVTNIDKVAPVAPVASADVTDPTNGQVVVSAEFSADTVKKEYSLDGVNFTEYSAGIEFAANGSVWFRGTDAAGNVSDVIKHEVTNIDKVAPAVPAVSVSVTESTNGQVVISAEFSADTVKKEYSLDGVEYSEYTGSVIFDDNGSVWFRGTDAAGNVSDVIKHEVTNIDKVAPVLTISGNAEGWTNGNVVLKAAASEADCVIEYQKDGEWAAYTDDGVTLEENGLVSFKVTDKAGNVTYQSEEVKFIDKVAPVLTTSYDSAWTEDPVTVYAAVKEEGVTITYQINGQGEWLAYADGVTVESNCVVNFKAVDKAGNATVENVKIDNIWGGDDVDDDVESDWTPAVVDKVDIKTTETHTDYAETELQFASGNTSIKVASGTKASKTGAYSVTTFEAGAITKAENAAGVNNINIGNYAELKINGEIEALGKLTIGKESAANVAGKVTGTAGNQTIQIGKASKAVFADIDLLGGKNTIKIGAGSDFAAQDIDNVSKLNVSNGKQGVMGSFAATAINGTAKNDTVSFGNWNNGFVDYKIDLGDGNDTLKIGNNSIVDLGKVDFGSGKDTLKIGKNSSVSVSELKKLEVFNAGKGTEIIFNNGAADIEFDSAMTGSWTNATLLDEAGELQMGENAVNVYSNEYDVFNFMAYKDGQLTLNSENADVVFEYQLDSSDKWLVYDGGLNLSAGDELSVRVAVDFVDKKDKFAKVAAAFDATLA